MEYFKSVVVLFLYDIEWDVFADKHVSYNKWIRNNWENLNIVYIIGLYYLTILTG